MSLCRGVAILIFKKGTSTNHKEHFIKTKYINIYGPKYAIMKILRFIAIFLAIGFNTLACLSLTHHISSTMDVGILVLLFTGVGWLLLGFAMNLILLLRHRQLVIFFLRFQK